MIAPATNPAPTPPQPHPRRRHCTVSTLAGTAFLITNAPDIGAAEATLANDEMLAAKTIAAAIFITELDILLPPSWVSPVGVALRPIIAWIVEVAGLRW